MGIYSYFTILADYHNLDEIKEKLKEISGYDFYFDGDKIHSSDEIKWYGYDEDMLKLSENFKDINFKMFREHGEGDSMNEDGCLESSHTYREYKNGISQFFEVKIYAVCTPDEVKD